MALRRHFHFEDGGLGKGTTGDRCHTAASEQPSLRIVPKVHHGGCHDDGPVNLAPVAVGDFLVGYQGKPATINVLANDFDPDGDTLFLTTAKITSGLGAVSFDPAGAVVFTPEHGFFGQATIEYTVADGRGGTGATVLSVNVIANMAPVIQEPVSFSIAENQLVVGALTAVDAEGDALTWSIAGGADAAFFTIDPVDGTLSFLGAPDFDAPLDQGGDNGYDVRVRVADGFGSDARDVLVTVTPVDSAPNLAPFFLSTGHLVLTGLSAGIIAPIFAVDPDGDTLEFQLFGEDNDIFGIDQATGEIFFTDPQMTGATLPLSFDGDRIYEVDVLVQDGHGGSAVLAVDLPLFLGG